MSEDAVIVEALARLRRGEAPAEPPESEALDRSVRDARARRRAFRMTQPNLTSMIDVTFLLLIAFVCATKVLPREGLLRADMTERGGSGVATDALALDETPLRIEIAREGGVTRIRVVAPTPQPSDAGQLGDILTSRRYGPQNPGGLFAADQPIELAPSKETPWDDTVAAFNAVTRAGYTRVGFARPR